MSVNKGTVVRAANYVTTGVRRCVERGQLFGNAPGTGGSSCRYD